MIYNKRKAGHRHDWGVVVLVLGSFSLPPLLYFRYILVYLYYSKKKNIHCASPALSSPALLSLVVTLFYFCYRHMNYFTISYLVIFYHVTSFIYES